MGLNLCIHEVALWWKLGCVCWEEKTGKNLYSLTSQCKWEHNQAQDRPCECGNVYRCNNTDIAFHTCSRFMLGSALDNGSIHVREIPTFFSTMQSNGSTWHNRNKLILLQEVLDFRMGKRMNSPHNFLTLPSTSTYVHVSYNSFRIMKVTRFRVPFILFLYFY